MIARCNMKEKMKGKKDFIRLIEIQDFQAINDVKIPIDSIKRFNLKSDWNETKNKQLFFFKDKETEFIIDKLIGK